VSTRAQTLLWLAQRVTGALLALAVVVHLGTIVYAVRGGLTAVEVLGRLQGNVAWLLFYVVFVAAAAVHAPIGLRSILSETTPLRASLVGALVTVFGVLLAALGWRAVFALYGYGGG
jgi:succinate dehydrogenase subunit C